MSGSVYTLVGSRNGQDAAIQVASGTVNQGQSGLFLPGEVSAAQAAGLALESGPASTPYLQLTAPTAAAGAAGVLTGVYRYVVTFVTAAGETISGPETSVTLSAQKGSLSSIPVGSVSSGVIGRNIYRTVANGASGTEKLLAQIADNTTTTFTDNIADGSLGTAVPTTDTSYVSVGQNNLAELTSLSPSARSEAINLIEREIGSSSGANVARLGSDGSVGGPGGSPLSSSVVSDSSGDTASPIITGSGNRHRAVRDVLSVMDYGAKGDGSTDDTTAVNECLADALARVTSFGRCHVVLPAGRAFQLGQLTVGSGIQLHAHGAVVNSLTNWSTGSGMLDWTVTTLSDFAVYGGLWVGTGSEQSVQNLFYSRSNRNVQDIRFEGMKLVNWGAGAFYLRNPTRAFVIGNTLINTGASAVGNAHGNAVNFVADGSQTFGGGLFAIGNYVESASAAIAFVNTATWAGGAVNLSVLGNRCVGVNTNANNNCGAITLCEDDTTSPITATDFIVIGNHVTNPVTDASSGALVIGGGSQAGSTVSRFIASKNNLITTSTASGVILKGTGLDGELTDNRITAPSATNGPIHDQSTSSNVTKSGNRFTTGARQGRATLVAGTVTVSTVEIQAGDNVHLSVVSAGGTRGIVQLGTITAGTSFVINSVQPGTASTLQTSDTSTVFWKIEH